MYRTIAKKGFWEFDSIIMQNLSVILLMFCTPTWPSHHVSENQEFTTEQLVKKMASRFASVTSKEITQINDEVVPKTQRKRLNLVWPC